MEKKIFLSLVIIATVTAIITSVLLVILFYDYYNPTESIKVVFMSILPIITGLIVFILISLSLFSSVLTAKIIEPIKIAIHNIESILTEEEIKETKIYDELEPFLETIRNQKKEIESYIGKLKETEKIRREFTANVSHELKTPLTSINGFAEMIETGMTKGPDVIKSAAIIRKEGNRLLEIIDSIIKLSRLDEPSVKRELTYIDLFSIVEFICTNLQPSTKQNNISLSFTGEITTIKGNQRMIEDLVFILVDNAIKYNKLGGSVSVQISQDSKFGIIKVVDTGIGIPIDQQDRVFERFYRVDKSRSKKVNGTGLGLSIVKHTVEYHYGDLSLSSIEGEGTSIEVRLPK
ncbi:ATP-binding protein [Tissierella sp.]|uniref:sensor histidine kinase n=1 Tax=Tissierella sp. TaxID=41274 RepID=UPI00285C8352|nr:ATP-binding protein [Tissierella sp.]MDR7857332.1 ATP-binding protein [Tissierella sp.]